MKIIECDQLSSAWFQAHLGRITASSAWKIQAIGKRDGKELQPRIDYKAQKLGEILTSIAVKDNYVSPDMEKGIEEEPYARASYAARYGIEVDEVGFILHPTIDRAGASPDGLVGNTGGIEIKVPRPGNHIKYLLWGLGKGEPPKDYAEKYLPQIYLNMRCADREWWDFISWCPGPIMPAHLRLFIKRIYREQVNGFIEDLDHDINQFNSEVDALIEQLNALVPADAPGVQHKSRITKQLKDSLGALTAADFEGLV